MFNISKEKTKRFSKNDEDLDKYQSLQKCLQAVEGSNKFGINNVKSLELVLSLVILPKFKALDFEKYIRTTDPSAHIRMYCQKRSGYEENEKLLIYCFQDSLTRVAL